MLLLWHNCVQQRVADRLKRELAKDFRRRSARLPVMLAWRALAVKHRPQRLMLREARCRLEQRTLQRYMHSWRVMGYLQRTGR